MAISITHTTVATGANDPGSQVSLNAWNESHTIQLATDKLVGRDTAGNGAAEEIGVSGGLEFTGAGGIQRSALTGDVTAPAGSNSTSIANDAVTYAKMQNVSAASRLLGRGSAGGSGDVEEVTLASSLEMIGAALGVSLATLANFFYPVGTILKFNVSTNPNTFFGVGTWVLYGVGRVIVCIDTGDPDFDTVDETSGAKTKSISAHTGTAVADHASHTHTYSDVPNHTHPVNITDPGHTHTLATGTGATGNFSQVIGTVDTSSGGTGGTPTQTALGTRSGSSTTGITATTSNNTGGVATGTTAGPSATLSHSVTQPSNHSDLNVVQPSISAYVWVRTA